MENKVITKKDERNALEQIKEIVKALGEDSYVATAFKGVFELAEENIKHDFWGSALDWQEEIERQDGIMRHTKDELTKAKRDLEITEKSREENYKRFREQEVRAIKAEEALAKTNETIEKQQDEIVRLKAKLYDMMTESQCRK